MNARADKGTLEKPDPKKLREMYRDNEFRPFFDWAISRKNDAFQTSIDRLMQVMHMRRTEVVALCRELEGLYCGRFVVGRRGAKSRMEWGYSLKSIGAVAKGEPGKIEDLDEEFKARDQLSSDDIQGENAVADGIEHPFPLRSGMTVKLRLPEDLTQKEANRLADWIKTLAFAD